MAVNNQTLLDAAWNAIGTNDYQQRVPRASQAGVAAVQEFLFAPMNRQYLNQFSNFLVNRIATHYIRQKAYKNPLAFLKNDAVPFGQTIEETAFKWLKAHSFNSDDMATETVLKTHYPDGASAFHSVNRQDVYEVSHNWSALKQAFTTEYGLNDYISAILQLPENSANYDEYRIMLNLFAEYNHYHGFYNVHVEEPTDEATAKALLRTLREYAELLKFPSAKYNAQDICDIPAFISDASELCLFITPTAKSFLDVEALAALFNVEYGEVPYKVVVVDEFPIPDTVAILAPEDFFMVNDTVNEVRTFENPHSLTTNVYLHKWGIYSTSPFVPAVRLTTGEGTDTRTMTQTVTGIDIEAPAALYLNDKASKPQLTVSLLGTLEGEENVCLTGYGVKPDSAVFTIDEVKDGEGQALAWTEEQIAIWPNGEAYVQARGNSKLAKAIKAGGVTATITAEATYINPSGETKEYTKSVTIPLKCESEAA